MADEEALDVNEGVDTTTEQESSPVEQESIADDTTEEVSEEETEGEEDADEQSDEQEDETEDKPLSKGEQRKDQLNTEIRDLVAERNRIRTQVEQLNARAYKTQTAEELMNEVNPDTGEYYNRLEAQLEAMKQERAIEKYNNQVSEAQYSLSNEAERALRDFPMFDANSQEYDPELAAEVDQILERSLEIDPRTGQIIGSRHSPYKLYKSYAMAARASAAKAQVKAKKDTVQMLTNADRPTGGKGKPSVPFNKMTTKQQEAYLRRKGHDV